MKEVIEFTHYQSKNQLDLFVCNNPKFKTNLIQLFIIEPLSAAKASKTALVPFVLYRGSQKFPSRRDLKIRLDQLYGADLTISVTKRGENQILGFTLEVVNEEFLPEKEPLLEQGMKLLFEIIFNPLFAEGFVEQEKDFLKQDIISLINDKYSYSIQRCYQEMCKQEPFGVFKLGEVDELEKINQGVLYRYYQEMINSSYMALFVIGDLAEERVAEQLEQIFSFRHRQPSLANNTTVVSAVNQTKEIIEELNVRQGKLCLGFRTAITRGDRAYYPLLFYNGILGSFPHSKLFQNVREKEGLAYYADSYLESTKGLLMITSGIDFPNYERAREIILLQVEQIKQGQITDNEYQWTKKALLNRYRSVADANKALSSHYLLGLINHKTESIDQFMKELEQVTKEEIIEVAQKIQLDTIYFLKKEEGKDATGN